MNTLSLRLGWPLYTGMAVAGAAAVVASASTLAGLATAAGWSTWTPWLLPAALDIGGSAGGWCWLHPTAPPPARRFGRIVALTGAGASLIGNAAGHLMATGYLRPGPVLVVIVGAVPAAVLVALAHLAALLAVPPTAATSTQHTDQETSDDRHQDDEPHEPRDGEPHEPDDGPGQTADTRGAVLHLLHERPHTIAELAQATGRSRTTVIGHLSALTTAGAIRRDEDKRYRAITRPHLIEDDASQEATR